ncbi:hypothetical protein [Rhizobium sp.]|uniref:hypothetical protein n=1 Tax=Rhizobium sp. TaxID=391 RepID=UPI0028B24FF2
MLKIKFSIDETTAAKDLAHNYNWPVLNDLIAISIVRAASIGAILPNGFEIEDLTKSPVSEKRVFAAKFDSYEGGEMSFIFAFRCQGDLAYDDAVLVPPTNDPEQYPELLEFLQDS